MRPHTSLTNSLRNLFSHSQVGKTLPSLRSSDMLGDVPPHSRLDHCLTTASLEPLRNMHLVPLIIGSLDVEISDLVSSATRSFVYESGSTLALLHPLH